MWNLGVDSPGPFRLRDESYPSLVPAGCGLCFPERNFHFESKKKRDESSNWELICFDMYSTYKLSSSGTMLIESWIMDHH
jgi:hypothetical protein